ncbi:MAG: discoidin domain-containing protein [Akkermansiaceae bacterium]|nr:discoidin domain-containing protein [Akkermansiaceae bacterium]
MRTLFISIALVVSVMAATAAPDVAPHFVDAAAQAKAKNLPYAVYVHGSSWHRASQIFAEQVWQSTDFHQALQNPVVLTNIHIKQHLDKEAAEKEAASYKGWDANTVRSYPAVQIYGPDGHLLKSYFGRELRILTTPSALASHIDHITNLSNKRTSLLTRIAEARQNKDTPKEINLLTQLVELPLNNEPKIIDALKQADPEDTSGWQARLSFQNWEFVRHITGLINDQKAGEALQLIDAMLDSKRHPPSQLCLILGAKGKTLVALERLPEAWQAFQQAYQIDPESPDSKAILRYGIRVAGIPLREAVPTDSLLFGKDPGDNLTRDHADFTMSSAASDDTKNHASLFKGPYATSGFAFHTDAEKDAHIIVDLKAACTVKALRITNRNSNIERAATLTVWVSTDQKIWQKIWSARKAETAWDIILDNPVTTHYVKVGLDSPTPEHLHLQAVDIYGQRP